MIAHHVVRELRVLRISGLPHEDQVERLEHMEKRVRRPLHSGGKLAVCYECTILLSFLTRCRYTLLKDDFNRGRHEQHRSESAGISTTHLDTLHQSPDLASPARETTHFQKSGSARFAPTHHGSPLTVRPGDGPPQWRAVAPRCRRYPKREPE
jgi:hypothetical protein